MTDLSTVSLDEPVVTLDSIMDLLPAAADPSQAVLDLAVLLFDQAVANNDVSEYNCFEVIEDLATTVMERSCLVTEDLDVAIDVYNSIYSHTLDYAHTKWPRA